MAPISRTEELILISVWRLQAEAYGLSVREEMSRLLERTVSVGAVYVPLERLARKGYLTSSERAPSDRRGGRRKRLYELSAKGVAALSEARALHDRAWATLPVLSIGS